GASELIREGATLVEGAGDVAEALNGLSGAPHAAEGRPLAQPGDTPEGISETVEIPQEYSRNLVEERLGPDPVAVDELLRQCQLSPPFLRMTLLELELAGRLQWHPGNRVSLLAHSKGGGADPGENRPDCHQAVP